MADYFYIRYKKLPLDHSDFHYKKVDGLYRKCTNSKHLAEYMYKSSDLSIDPILIEIIKGDKNAALLNLRHKRGFIRFLSKEVIINQNEFKLIKI
jgi:hypothetical protein